MGAYVIESLALTLALAVASTPPVILTPEAVVQKQVDAYNAHDLDSFISCYGDSIEFRTMDGKVGPEKGLPPLRKGYGDLFSRFPTLKVKILKRIVQGSFVIDQEQAEGMGPEPMTVTAIYETAQGKIIHVWFIDK
jgi:putative hydrolase of HD superfamily